MTPSPVALSRIVTSRNAPDWGTTSPKPRVVTTVPLKYSAPTGPSRLAEGSEPNDESRKGK